MFLIEQKSDSHLIELLLISDPAVIGRENLQTSQLSRAFLSHPYSLLSRYMSHSG